MNQELMEIYDRNFPMIVRSRETVERILEHEDNIIIEKRDDEGRLIGVSVVNGNTILLLCVDAAYRNRGLGTELLMESEHAVRERGGHEISAGAGFDYIMPGVPTARRYFKAENERLSPGLDETASSFFEKRGYTHSWGGNCFDLRFPLREFDRWEYCVGDTIENITYRWALPEDLEAVRACTDDAYQEFTQYYLDRNLYKEGGAARVLAAAEGGVIAGVLIVGREDDDGYMGSVGCTAVRPTYRGRHIAERMVTIGTRYLADAGVEEAFLSYTYSGLDHLYGSAGYKICIYYMMAVKALE